MGAFIWMRDPRWWDAVGDTLPILAALPLFYWLGRPWVRRPGPARRLASRPVLLAAALFPAGIILDSGFALALGWTALLWSWLSATFVESSGAFLRKLLILPVLSFPWLMADFERISWWFRLSGAAATEKLLSLGGAPVVREGTLLWINGLALSVEPACSGVNGLQSMLIAGGVLLYLKLRHTALFWWNLPVLAGAAWLAHLFRIMIAALCGVMLDPTAAARWVGPVHELAGWLGLVGGFVFCFGWFGLQATWLARNRGAWLRAGMAKLPWPGLILLAYGMFAARGLIDTWRVAPYDRLSWLAFLIWLLPLFWPGATSLPAPRRFTRRQGGLLFAGCLVFLAAAAADVNALNHIGLAIVLASFQRRDSGWIWLMGAAAWMPLAGWLGSRVGIAPAGFSTCRVLAAAVAASGWVWYAVRWGRPAPAGSRLVWLRRRIRHAD